MCYKKIFFKELSAAYNWSMPWEPLSSCGINYLQKYTKTSVIERNTFLTNDAVISVAKKALFSVFTYESPREHEAQGLCDPKDGRLSHRTGMSLHDFPALHVRHETH